MEQILIFVLGATFTLGLIGLGYLFVSVLKMKNQIIALKGAEESLNRDLNQTHREIDENQRNLESEIHQRIDGVYSDIEERIKEIYSRVDELNRYVDSRFDKQADKTASTLSLGNSVLYDKVEKLESLFKLQMDQFAKVTLNHSERISELETDKKIQEDRIEQINS